MDGSRAVLRFETAHQSGDDHGARLTIPQSLLLRADEVIQ